jgi:hypothetical protein
MRALRFDDLRQHTDVLRLRNGQSLTVRFVEPQDAETLQNYFRSLSVGSRYNRFLGAMRELPQTELGHFIHAGEDDRFSVIALMTIDGFETIVGEARYGFEPDTASFEFGLSVDDRWQARVSVRRCSGIWNAARPRSVPSACSATPCAPTT